MIRWSAAEGERLAPPGAALALVERGVAADPHNPALRTRLAMLALDRFDYRAAAEALEAALDLDPDAPHVRPALARCYNLLRRPERALTILTEEDASPQYERAMACYRLGRMAEAEAELRGLLTDDPQHRHACRQLCKLLRKSGRREETLTLCEDLHARGAAHAQLFHDWGFALALCGESERARALLLDSSRVAELALPVPEGFADIVAFNAALAGELLGSPYILGDFPSEEEANRGSRRVHALFAGARPDLVRALLTSLERIVGAWAPPRAGPFDPWLDARPTAAHLRAWGLIQRGADYEEWHIHRGGWVSGVYYIRVPASVAADGEGRGCIEYGPPPRLEETLPGLVPPRRVTPREGHLLLAPSHYPHRTIPTGADEHRISFAFDVVPES